MTKIYVTRVIPGIGLDLLNGHFDRVTVHERESPPSTEELHAAVRGCCGLLTTVNETIDEGVLAAAGPGLRVVANFGVGVNHIDVEAAGRRGIVVTNTPGVLTETTADLTWALILAVARRIVEGDRLVRGGRWTGWQPSQMLGGEVHGTTLGIVGAGRIGTAVGRRARAFDMRILYVGHRPNQDLDRMGGIRVSLEQCLRESDFVTLHVPLTDQTRHLIGAGQLQRMKPTAFLINTTRGPVIHESALVEALKAGVIRGAGLDVYENEPRLADGLAELPNVVCLPHLGSATEQTRARMAEMAARNLIAVLSGGQPENPVHPQQT